jgi:hypothetical protein
MNLRYPNSLLLGLSLLTFQAAAFSWGATGHMLTAQIAQDNLQPQTLQIVNEKLAYPLQFPQLSFLTKKDTAPGKLAKKLDSIVLASTWADAVKGYKHWPRKSVYSEFHFGGNHLTVYPSFDAPNLTTQKSNQDNITSAIASCIKTLINKNSNNSQQAIALRYLIHLVGDIHQPLHVTEPDFKLNGTTNQTAGGNNILFNQPKAAINNYLVTPGSQLTTSPNNASELHAYIDDGATSFINIPTPWIWPFHGQALWQQHHQQYLAYIQQQAGKTEQRQSSRIPAPQPQVSAIAAAAQSYRLAITLLNPKNDVVHYQTTTQKHWGKPALLISYPQGINKFNSIVDPIIDQQIYLGGKQLANYLNAIYTPKKAQPQYITYIDSIKNNPNIMTFSQLAQHWGQQTKSRYHHHH